MDYFNTVWDCWPMWKSILKQRNFPHKNMQKVLVTLIFCLSRHRYLTKQCRSNNYHFSQYVAKRKHLDLFSRVCGALIKPHEQKKLYQPWCFLLAPFRDHISASQPEPRRLDSGIGSGILDNEDGERTINGLCFSQPVHPDHMLLSTQMQSTPGASQVKPISFLWLSWLVQYCRQQWWW